MGEPATDNESVAALHEGVLVAEKYRLIKPIGEGAMGHVWSAQHATLGHTVAVKFLHGSVATSAEPRARFEREARLAAKLGEASRHITRVTDHGVTSEGTPFLVMELLSGEGLEVRLKRERRLPFFLITKITSQLCRALHVAHGAGVIHRDLKPANVFLCESEEDGEVFVKLLDFGVAKATLDQEENQQTRAGALIGTPNYMSPEQIVGDSAVDARSDLWALAAIVYRMAVGRAPFGSGSLSELAMRIVSTEPPQATTLAPDLPHEFDLWVQKGLAKKPAVRFQTARELTDSLAMVAGISSAGSTGGFSSMAAERLAIQIGDSVGGLQHTVSGEEPAPVPSSPIPVVVRPRSRGPLFAVFGALCVIGVGIGVYAARSQKPTPASQAPVTGNAPTASITTAATPVATPAPTAAPPEAKLEAPKVDESVDAAGGSASLEPKAGGPVSGAPKVTTKWPKAYPKAVPTVVATATATATAAPTPTVTAAPVPTDVDKKSGDLWKKKDEM